MWKNPVTGELHLQVHPCGASELFIDALPDSAKHEGALYPDGAHLTDLGEVRDLIYKMQRPAIAPSVSCPEFLVTCVAILTVRPFQQLVYPHDWYVVRFTQSYDARLTCIFDRQERDLVIFHNRGVLHSVVGAFKPDQVRAFHQCNLAASDDPVGPNPNDVQKWA